MTINEGTKKFRLPNHTTEEDLEMGWRHVLRFGAAVLVAGYYCKPEGRCCFGAVYEHIDDDMSCEGTISIKAISDVEFEDAGHAMAWALKEAEA